MIKTTIPWIDNMPADWKIKRLKNIAKIKTGDKDTINRNKNGKYPFYVRSQKIERINSYTFEGEAILTAGDGVGVGKVFHYVNEKFDYHQRVYKISDFKGIDGKYLFYYIKNNLPKEIIRKNAKSTVDLLRLPMFLGFPVTFGTLAEQREIVNILDNKISSLSKSNLVILSEIEKLQEYKKILIHDVVTGKMKVTV